MRRFLRISISILLVLIVALCFMPFSASETSPQGSNSAYDGSIAQPIVSETEVNAVTDVLYKAEAFAGTVDNTVDDQLTVTPSKSPVEEDSYGNNSSFWIEFIDVGQGDAAIIQCDGHYMLIDGGPSSASSVVYTVLKNFGISYLDYMIATHPDSDHIGGLAGALNYSDVGVCYSPVMTHHTKAFESLIKYLNERNASMMIPSPGTVFLLGSAQVELIGPLFQSSDTNNSSIVAMITYGNTKFLFMGDAEIEEENSLIEVGIDLSCDVLKLGHHGSNSSTSERFLEYSNPQYVVLSVGEENSYGHPTTDTLSKIRAIGSAVYRTDIQGDILCESDGESVYFSTERMASDEALWIEGPSANITVTRDGIVVTSPNTLEIPEGTTYVLNTNSMKFHLTTCESVKDIAEKNRAFTSESSENLLVLGYKPCGRCKPCDEHVGDETGAYIIHDNEYQESGPMEVYVLNTHTLKFHHPDCASVSDISERNRKDVTMSREEIISQGYSPCKRCNP